MLSSVTIFNFLFAMTVFGGSLVEKRENGPTPTWPMALDARESDDAPICGSVGYVKKPAIAGTIEGFIPVEACAKHCSMDKSAASFSYRQATTDCQCFAKSLEDMEFTEYKKPQKLPTRYYDLKCFKGKTTRCGVPFPAPTFFLQVAPSGSPLDKKYAVYESATVNGDSVLELGLHTNKNSSNIFTLTPECDLLGPYAIGDGVSGYGQVDESGSGSVLIDYQGEYYDFKKSKGWPGLRCRIDKRIVSCEDPTDGAMQFFYCPGAGNNVHVEAKVPKFVDGHRCYGITFRTVAFHE